VAIEIVKTCVLTLKRDRLASTPRFNPGRTELRVSCSYWQVRSRKTNKCFFNTVASDPTWTHHTTHIIYGWVRVLHPNSPI